MLIDDEYFKNEHLLNLLFQSIGRKTFSYSKSMIKIPKQPQLFSRAFNVDFEQVNFCCVATQQEKNAES